MPTSTTASFYAAVKIEQIRRVFMRADGVTPDFETIETAYFDKYEGKLVVTVYLPQGVKPEIIQHPLQIIGGPQKETP